MMAVCFFKPDAKSFDETTGGVQRVSRVLGREFEKKGIATYFLTTQTAQIGESDEKLFYLPESRIDSAENVEFVKSLFKDKGIRFVINQDALNLSTHRFLKKLSTQFSIISVHHNCISCLFDRYTEMFRINRPTFLSGLADFFAAWHLIKWLYIRRSTWIWKEVLGFSSAVVLLFQSFSEELSALNGLSSEKIRIIPNPAPFNSVRENGILNKKIIYVGRVEKNQKRIDRLLQVWKQLHEMHDDWTFELIGSGSYLPQAQQFVKDNGLNRIHFQGTVDPIDYLDKADIFTLTSDFEGFGMVLIEAQARGVVPVAYNSFSAITDIIDDGNSGYLIDGYDEGEMVRKVSFLMNNSWDLKRMKHNALNQSQKFDREKIAAKWLSLFHDLELIYPKGL